MQNPENGPEAFDPKAVTRPAPELLYYYVLLSALGIIAFPFVLVPLLCKYFTLRYSFDDKGVSMSWGVLFHKEIYLTYRRIQDIHVTRNLFHRWLGLASVALQTAGGTAGAEMTIEGLRQPELLRDFLYSQMRGAREEGQRKDAEAPCGAANEDDVLLILREIRAELGRLGRRCHHAGTD